MTKKKKDDEKCQKREERKIKYEAFMQKHKETLEFESVSSMELSLRISLRVEWLKLKAEKSRYRLIRKIAWYCWNICIQVKWMQVR